MTPSAKLHSTTVRPVPRIPRSLMNVVLDVVAFTGVVVCVVIVVGSWSALPEAIPQHFGWLGRPDAWGGRWILVFRNRSPPRFLVSCTAVLVR